MLYISEAVFGQHTWCYFLICQWQHMLCFNILFISYVVVLKYHNLYAYEICLFGLKKPLPASVYIAVFYIHIQLELIPYINLLTVRYVFPVWNVIVSL